MRAVAGFTAALNPDLGADPLPENSSYWDMSGRGSATTPPPSALSASVSSRCHCWTFLGSWFWPREAAPMPLGQEWRGGPASREGLALLGPGGFFC